MKQAALLLLIVISLAIAACGIATTYGKGPERHAFEKDAYYITVYVNAFASKADRDRVAAEEITKLMEAENYQDYSILRVSCGSAGTNCVYEVKFHRGDAPQVARAPENPGADLNVGRDLTVTSTGTGFLVDQEGHMLTNAHVTDRCRLVRVPALDDQPAVVIRTDPENDLALIRIPGTRHTAFATFREGRNIRAGDDVVAVGFPLTGILASEANVTTGAVSAMAGLGGDVRFLQITAPVQPGNSGGPLFDGNGNVVGVVVGKLDALRVARVTGDVPQNINFAINASVARTFLDAAGIDYETAPSERLQAPADIGQHAKTFTALVECWT